MIFVGIALLAAAVVAWLALLRWLILIVLAIVLIGFAFEPELQFRFTAALLGVLAILYLLLCLVACLWRQVTRQRHVISQKAAPPLDLEMAYQALADEEARHRSDQQNKATREARDRDDRDSRSRDLERQGMLSLWSRR